jgi:hypothetical protein
MSGYSASASLSSFVLVELNKPYGRLTYHGPVERKRKETQPLIGGRSSEQVRNDQIILHCEAEHRDAGQNRSCIE